ncbi:gas vesicle protein GvpN [Methanosarcina spelaei]|uniref:Gas vesicle protein GvpN n=1 Tax=Methanosarcina spelaei TaxID=1036679 RepID=A0A2A2HUL9_9EURY|nr:gas vesicle protein GvpN [Methanosarcina spelaei]PAV13092.1 gas vesicle protein GvpN [Methanosarcina spelaei]
MIYKATHPRKVRGESVHQPLSEKIKQNQTNLKTISTSEMHEKLKKQSCLIDPKSLFIGNLDTKNLIQSEYFLPNTDCFVEGPDVKELSERIKLWIGTGYPVHLIGPTGCGKTSLVMHIAKEIGRPVVWINGDDALTTKDLTGGYAQIKQESMRDHYIHNVIKSADIIKPEWIDNPLAIACKYGCTFVYNEFSRAKPTANNVLLSVFEEGILELPSKFGQERYLKVHPEFRAILTSNSIEYAGIHAPQDALLDRMVGIYMDYYSLETEIDIVRKHTNIPYEEAKNIVFVIRKIREQVNEVQKPGTRAAIMVGKAMKQLNGNAEKYYNQLFIDVIATKTGSNVDLFQKEKLVNNVISQLT